MVLLICSGLFLRSLQSAVNTETGFAHRNLLMMAFDPSLNRYSHSQTQRLVDAMVERTRAIPGVAERHLRQQHPAGHGRHPERVCS